MREGTGLAEQEESVGLEKFPNVHVSEQVIRIPARDEMKSFVRVKARGKEVFDSLPAGSNRIFMDIHPHDAGDNNPLFPEKGFPPPIPYSQIQHGRDARGKEGMDKGPNLRVFLPLNGAVMVPVIMRSEGGHANHSRGGKTLYFHPLKGNGRRGMRPRNEREK